MAFLQSQKFSLKGLIKNGGEQGIEFGGGLSLKMIEIVYF